MNRRSLFIALVALTFLIVVASLGPFDFRKDFATLLRHRLPLFGRLAVTPHRLLHFAAFGLLGILVVLISTRGYQMLLGLASVITLGLSIELLQYLFSRNPFESWDLRDDAGAACLGHLAALAYVYCASRRSGSSTEMRRFHI